jgi:acyl dehydratase
MGITFEQIQVGDELPPLQLPPVTRTTLALFAGASGDHNPIHIDLDFARGAGQDDVFAHGMLTMAYIGRLLTGWIPQRQLRSFNLRFQGITHLRDALECTGKVIEKSTENGQRLVRVEVASRNHEGLQKAVGEALIGF